MRVTTLKTITTGLAIAALGVIPATALARHSTVVRPATTAGTASSRSITQATTTARAGATTRAESARAGHAPVARFA